MTHRKLTPNHPADALALDFLEPLGVFENPLAKDISVPARRSNEIVYGKRSISWIARVGLIDEHAAAARQPMHDGVDVIYLGALVHGRWHGFSDFLLCVEKPSPVEQL